MACWARHDIFSRISVLDWSEQEVGGPSPASFSLMMVTPSYPRLNMSRIHEFYCEAEFVLAPKETATYELVRPQAVHEQLIEPVFAEPSLRQFPKCTVTVLYLGCGMKRA